MQDIFFLTRDLLLCYNFVWIDDKDGDNSDNQFAGTDDLLAREIAIYLERGDVIGLEGDLAAARQHSPD